MARLGTVILILCTVFLFSCKKEVERKSQFAGNWVGTYSGSENGRIAFVVDTEGRVSGSTTITGTTQANTATGSIDDYGTITFSTGTATTGTVFTANFKEATKVDGGWVKTVNSSTTTGTWTATKQ